MGEVMRALVSRVGRAAHVRNGNAELCLEVNGFLLSHAVTVSFYARVGALANNDQKPLYYSTLFVMHTHAIRLRPRKTGWLGAVLRSNDQEHFTLELKSRVYSLPARLNFCYETTRCAGSFTHITSSLACILSADRNPYCVYQLAPVLMFVFVAFFFASLAIDAGCPLLSCRGASAGRDNK